MSTLEPGAVPDGPVNQVQLSKDSREFGITVANAVQAELEGKADEERLQAIQGLFMQAVDHIEKRYGLTIGTKCMKTRTRRSSSASLSSTVNIAPNRIRRTRGEVRHDI